MAPARPFGHILCLLPTDAIANPGTCAGIAPTVTLGINGGAANTFTDSAQVLNTGGFDFVKANPCPVAGDTPGNCNESLQWRLIGTTGIENPGGTPEPGTIALMGTGLLALGLGKFRHRKR